MNKRKTILAVCGHSSLFAVANTFGSVLKVSDNTPNYDKMLDTISRMEVQNFKPWYISLDSNLDSFKVGSYEDTEKNKRIVALKELVEKSLSYQPNRFLNKELHKYQFKKSV